MSNNQTAAELAAEYESGGKDLDGGGGSKGKRSKAEQAEHKHPQPGGDTRKLVSNWMHGEEKRRQEGQKGHNEAGAKHSADKEAKDKDEA